jgi:rhodanese-related sulfurtransferase
VADLLTSLGDWGDVANCTGGILEWAQAGLPYTGAPPT